MVKRPAAKRKAGPGLSREIRESDALERVMIIKAMRRWESMDVVGRGMGRGLGRKELIERVALEVGTSQRQVHSALRS